MTLEEKVGQLVMIGAHARYMSEDSASLRALRRAVVENRVGGVIWFRSNVYEAAVLGAELQREARLPLLFAADLESGTGMRFDDTTQGPWAMALAATSDPELAERRGEVTAREARALGIGQVYAPVADVNVNPANPVINVRSFGEDPADVSRFVAATVRGLNRGGVLATLKHFPGHGDTSVDSHRSLPVLAADRERLFTVELLPFRAGLAAQARSVMVGHLAVPALDNTPAPPLVGAAAKDTAPDAPGPLSVASGIPEVETQGTLPATLSKPITTGLLRKELAFEGLIVTDALDMGGIVAHFTSEEAAVRAVEAGADQLLKPPDSEAAIRGVLAAVRSGRLSEARIDESVRRILIEKGLLGLFESRTPPLPNVAREVGRREHEELEAEIAKRSLTLVREEKGALPLNLSSRLVHLIVLDDAFAPALPSTLVNELGKRANVAWKTVALDPRSTREEADAVGVALEGADAILVSLFVRARSGAGRIAVPELAKPVLKRAASGGKPAVAVSFGSPYLLLEFPDFRTYLCAYGSQDVVQAAVARALLGEAGLAGRLPVSLPGLAPRGTGLVKSASQPTSSASPIPVRP